MFAGLVTKGIVITKLNSYEKKELRKLKITTPFVAGKRIINSWIRVDLEPSDLKDLMPFVKKSYEHALVSS
jgi:hypothetical protein